MKKDEIFSDLQRFILLECAKNANYPVIRRRTIYETFFKLKLSSKQKGKMLFKFDEDPKNAPSILSRSIRNMRDRGFIDERHTNGATIRITVLGVEEAKRLQNEQTKSIEAPRSQSEIAERESAEILVNEEPKVTPADEEDYQYTFTYRIYYIDEHSPERQLKSREIKISIIAPWYDIAVRRAEREARRISVNGDYESMTAFGSVAIVRSKKRE